MPASSVSPPGTADSAARRISALLSSFPSRQQFRAGVRVFAEPEAVVAVLEAVRVLQHRPSKYVAPVIIKAALFAEFVAVAPAPQQPPSAAESHDSDEAIAEIAVACRNALSGLPASVLALFKAGKGRGWVPSKAWLATGVKAAMEARATPQVVSLLLESVTAGHRVPVRTFNEAITLCARHGGRSGWSQALQLFNTLQTNDSGIEPTAASYKAILLSASLCGQQEWALTLLDEAVAADNASTDAYQYAIASCVPTSDVGIAMQLLDEFTAAMESSKRRTAFSPTRRLYNSALRVCATAGDPDTAHAVVLRMKEAGIHPSEASFASVVRSYAGVQDVAGALKAIKEMQQQGVVPGGNVYHQALSVCAEAGDLLAATTLLAQMQAEGVSPTPAMFTYAMQAAFLAGDDEAVLDLFAQLRQGKPPSALSYSLAIVACGRTHSSASGGESALARSLSEASGSAAEAMDMPLLLLAEFEARGLPVDQDVLANVAQALQRRGHLRDAVATMRRAVRVVRNSEPRVGVNPRLRHAMNEIVAGLAEQGHTAAACVGLDVMRSVGCASHTHTMSAVCTACLSTPPREQPQDSAVPAAELLLGEPRGNTSDLFRRGLETLGTMEQQNKVASARCYDLAIAGCLQRGQLDEAQELRQRMKAVGGLSPTLPTLLSLGVAKASHVLQASLPWRHDPEASTVQGDQPASGEGDGGGCGGDSSGDGDGDGASRAPKRVISMRDVVRRSTGKDDHRQRRQHVAARGHGSGGKDQARDLPWEELFGDDSSEKDHHGRSS